MQKIIILDFSTGEVHVFNYDSRVFKDGEDFISQAEENHGIKLREKDCQWMISPEEELEITFH